MGVHWLVLFVVAACFSRITAEKPACLGRWKKVGCFRDKHDDRAMQEEVANDRDVHSNHFIGQKIDWEKFPESTETLACECAKRTSAKGYQMFGLQFYGECWTGPNAEVTFNKHGVSDHCKGVDYEHCEDDSSMLCVGEALNNYVYQFVPGDEGEAIDGGFTEWSDWSVCTKTCGGGEMHRTRTCTNPEPQNGGQECEGETKEMQECNCHPCGGPTECRMAMDFGIIVDTSSSVGKRNVFLIRGMLITLIGDFEISRKETRVGLISYSTRPRLQFPFNRYFNSRQMANHIQHMYLRGGGTRTDRALQMAESKLFNRRLGYRRKIPNVLMVITDGKTNPGSKPYPEVLAPLKELDVTTIAVGVGKRTKDRELLEIAMGKKENVIHMDSYDDLKARLQSMMGKICQGIRARHAKNLKYK